MRKRLILVVVVGLCSAVAGGVTAQDAPESMTPTDTASLPSPEALDDLLLVLRDETARDRLIGRLEALRAVQQVTGNADATVAAESDTGSTMAFWTGPPPYAGTSPPETVTEPLLESVATEVTRTISDRIALLVERGQNVIDTLAGLPDVITWLRAQAVNPRAGVYWGGLLGTLGVVLAAAVLVTLPVYWLGYRGRRRVARGPMATRWRDRLVRNLLDWLSRLPAPLIFVGLALLAIEAIAPLSHVRLVTTQLVLSIAVYWGIAQFVTVLLRSHEAPLRLINLSDSDAGELDRRLRRAALFAVSAFFVATMDTLLRLPAAVSDAILAILALGLTLQPARLVWRYRKTVVDTLAPPRPAIDPSVDLRRRLAGVWHWLVLLYLAILYVVWAAGVEDGFRFIATATLWSLAVLGIATGAMVLVGRLEARARAATMGTGARLSEDDDAEPTDPEAPVQEPPTSLIAIVAQGGIVILAGLALLEAWGLGGLSWIASELGQRLGATLLSLGVLIAISTVAVRVVDGVFKRSIAASEQRGVPPETLQRFKTVLPLLRNALYVLVFAVVVLVGLSELGIDITPLLAGAGVIGLAIGFGSQALVRDVITGVFMLIEDTAAVGDVVEVGGHSGVVESMSIRALRLRDLAGKLHTIPFGTISTVTNYTKEFSYALFDVAVGFEEDADGVMALMQETADRLFDDPAQSVHILEPMEMLGVDRFTETGMVIKARLKTRPGFQWQIGRTYNRLLKHRFDSAGIAMPVPQRAVLLKGVPEGWGGFAAARSKVKPEP